jgi:hypothetical protein
MNPYSPPATYAPSYATSPTYDPGATQAVSETAIEFLRQTRPWVLFLAVLAFLGSGFLLLAGVVLAITGLVSKGQGFESILGLAYVPVALIYLYPAIKMWTYASAISRLVLSRSTSDLEVALAQQKHLWKFLGIAAIVMIVVYLVAFAAIALTAMAKLHD